MSAPRRILFVDDDIFYAQSYFARILHDRIDCDLTTSGSVDDAISQIDNQQFDVIVLDLMMLPGRLGERSYGGLYSGFELARHARASNLNRQAKVFIYTTHIGVDPEEFVKINLVDAIVLKPDYQKLIDLIVDGAPGLTAGKTRRWLRSKKRSSIYSWRNRQHFGRLPRIYCASLKLLHSCLIVPGGCRSRYKQRDWCSQSLLDLNYLFGNSAATTVKTASMYAARAVRRPSTKCE